MNALSFDVNNGGFLRVEMCQSGHDRAVKVCTLHSGSEESFTISPGDMVMLLNYYRYIRNGDYRCDFINPNGKNVRDAQ